MENQINKIGLNSNADARLNFSYTVDADNLEDALIQAFQEHVSRGFSHRIVDIGVALGDNDYKEAFRVKSVKVLTGTVVKVDFETIIGGGFDD